MNLRNSKSNIIGWTLIELTIVIAIVALIVGIAIAALSNSKSDTQRKNAEANAKVINEAITRAVLRGDTNPVIVGEDANDVRAAVIYLMSEGYIR